MGERFIGEEVKVTYSSFGNLDSFEWRGQQYKIVEVINLFRALDLRRPWWRRRHRDFFTVKVDTGQVFKLYFHRGPGRRYWVLYSELIE